MLKFIRGKGTHLSAERIKLQKELFGYRKTVTHGFPSKPTALAYDRELGLLAVANKSGYIVVVGQPGVEFAAQHPSDESAVIRILFVPKTAKLITLCDNNSLHLWRFRGSKLELVKSYSLEGKLKKISTLFVKADGKQAYVGTESGNVYTLDVEKFEIGDKIIYLDVVLQNGPENYKVNPGAVEAILEIEAESKLLIGYERGLIVLWDLNAQKNLRNYLSNQQLEDLSWIDEDSKSVFVSAHNDGSYIMWDVENGQKPKKDATTPYGPFPCKRIGKIRFWKDAEDEQMCAFSGGMPRAAYGDHFTVTVKSEGLSDDSPHVTFDLTSKVIDFAVVYPLPGVEEGDTETAEDEDKEDSPNSKRPIALAILAEEELIMVDLKSTNWPTFYPLPYLNSIHPSAVTCFQHVESVSEQVYNALKKITGKGENSKNPWPITGGKITTPETTVTNTKAKTKDKDKGKSGKSVLITGHEDGSVRFWDSSGICLTLLAKFNSSVLFSSSDDLIDCPLNDSNAKDDEDDEWPPFRKVGVFDPYSDDPRLAVKKVSFCPTTGVLVIGGTAGQVVVVNSLRRGIITEEPSKLEITSCNLVADKDGFAWKGHGSLDYKPKNNPNIGNREGEESFFSVGALLQIQPPAAITALALDAPTGLTAVGTAHGVLLYDFFRKKVVVTRSTLNPNDIMAAGDTPISRRKSIKKSLRESFRRLRKGRSQRLPQSPVKSPSMSGIHSGGNEPPAKSVERAIEARDESMTSMVRCVAFAKTYIVSLQTTTPTLWVGTNAGTVYVFTINIPGGERRSKEDVGCQIAKEIQLKHRAPVLSVIILDCNTQTVEGFSPQHDHLGPHKVIISSEEQIKIFTLPALRPFGKLKLTAQEGSRLRQIRVQTFTSSTDDSYSEKCLSCVTNQGDIYVIAVPELRKQIIFHHALKREDITGISSFTLNERGEAIYQISSSELQRLSISISGAIVPRCSINGHPEVEIKAASSTVESASNSNHISHNPTTSISNSSSTGIEDSTESGDITIDSVRDHINNPSPVPPAVSSTTVVEERLIDGGALTSNGESAGAKNQQIRSVTTVTTTTVVNSVQNSTGSASSAATASTTASSETTVVRAPLAEAEREESSTSSSSTANVAPPRESAL